MITYKSRSSLHFLSIHAIHLDTGPIYRTMREEATHHGIQGEFLYCGLLTDGKVMVSEVDMDELLPLLDLQVFKVEGTSMYVNSGETCTTVSLHVEHVSLEHFEDDDEEDEEMIFVARKKRGSIVVKGADASPEQRLAKHLLGRSELGFA